MSPSPYRPAPFWAKTLPGRGATYPLERHLLDTAAAAMALWDAWLRPGLREQLADAVSAGDQGVARAVIAAVAGLHDIGKANPRFQTSDGAPQWSEDIITRAGRELEEAGFSLDIPAGALEHRAATRRHETVSQHLLGGFPESPSARIRADWAGVAVGGHHGRFHGKVNLDAGECSVAVEALDELISDSTWQDARTELMELVAASSGTSLDEIARPLPTTGVPLTLISGLVAVADWLASAALSTAAHLNPAPGEEREAWARRYVADRHAEFTRNLPATLGVYTPPADARTAVLGGHAPRPVQEAAERAGRGLWIVAETTGSGKTEAAMLRHMNEPEAVIWGLPTRATADTMWDRVQPMYTGTGNVGALLHAHRSLNSFYLAGGSEHLALSDWATSVLGNVKPLLSPVAVGTVDQILLGALRQKWTHVRLLAIANAHIILDEVHTYDVYQAELACAVLRWAGLTGARVTMLSASLPHALIRQFTAAYAGTPVEAAPAYPAHYLVEPGADAAPAEPLVTAREYTLNIDLAEAAPGDVAADAARKVTQLRAAHPHARIAVVLNRVDSVIEVGRRIPDALVAHSRMTSGHRSRVAAAIEERFGKHRTNQAGGVIVGTQVIEASLDYDVDFMVTELAPAASLIQRAGRLWRHSTPNGGTWEHAHPRPTDEPTLHVIVPGSLRHVHPSAALPYAHGALQRTLNALAGGESRTRLAIPTDVQRVVDAAHFDMADGDTADSEETGKAFARLARARDVVVRAADRNGPFASRVSHATFSTLTGRGSEFEEAATRFTDYDQVTIVITTPTGDENTIADDALEHHLGSTKPSDVRDVLTRTVPVSASAAHSSTQMQLSEDTFVAGTLRGVTPATLAGARYDDRLGLMLDRAESF